jgi:hypothetical protein
MKKFDSIGEAQRDYEDKQKGRPEITPVEHSQRYEEKLKKYKTPPSAEKNKHRKERTWDCSTQFLSARAALTSGKTALRP